MSGLQYFYFMWVDFNAYHLVTVNYGDVATHEEAEVFGATLLDLDQDDYDDYNSESVDLNEVNIDEYISDDEIPSYRLESNNYSSDDEEL